MKSTVWVSDLIIDPFQMRRSLYFWIENDISVKSEASDVSDSSWIWGKVPIKKNKVLKFAFYILTGKAVVLFIQSGDLWLTGEWENLLIGGFQCKFKHEGEVIRIDYQWSRKTDLGCGEKLTCWGWFNEEEFRNYKQGFVEGLVPEYQKLWLKP